jgi:hypothetical protein
MEWWADEQDETSRRLLQLGRDHAGTEVWSGEISDLESPTTPGLVPLPMGRLERKEEQAKVTNLVQFTI